MDGNKQGKVYLDCATGREPSNGRSISRVIRLQNVIPKEEADDIHYVYSSVTRYLLLKTLSFSEIPSNISFIKEMKPNEFSVISKVMGCLGKTFFHDDFVKILDAGEGKISISDVVFAEFLISRCLMLCGGELTHVTFTLVAAFLSNLVSIDVCELDCFHTLYICEFCLKILYRRMFWKIFQSKEDYEKLRTFCEEFFKSIEQGMTLNEFQNTDYGSKWCNLVRKCIDTTEDRFWLEDLEIEVFENHYSVESHMEYNSYISPEIQSRYFHDFDRSQIEEFLCDQCTSKCYKYLEHASMFL